MELQDVQKEADSAARKAILFGLVALFFAAAVGAMFARLAGGGPQTQQVVVAAHRVAPLTQLKVEDLRLVQWPVQSLPDGTFQLPEDVIKLGQINIGGLLAGEPVLKERLSTPDRGLGMSQMVEPNKRAFVVQVADSVANSSILHPGASVDVTATLNDDKTRSTVTKMLLQNVQILAVGDSIDVERMAPPEDGKEKENDRNKTERHRVVTLSINATDVELMTFASRYGTFDLTLRNNNDTDPVVPVGITMDKIMGRDKRGMHNDPNSAATASTSGSVDAPEAAPQHRSRAPHSTRRQRPADSGPAIIGVDN